jgi:hypothetical protein
LSPIESTYKSKDTEEIIDRLFFRPAGYGVAVISAKLKITPNALTIISIILGVTAGHLYYYVSIPINLLGILIFIIADVLDSADGQLARITNNSSKTGRIFDGVATNLISISIYMHLILRSLDSEIGWWMFLIAAIAGASHVMQAATVDFYRHAYLYIVCGKEKSDLDSSKDIQEQIKNLSWKGNYIDKFFLIVYLDYTRRQEFVSRKFLELINYIKSNYDIIPEWLSNDYRASFRKMNKYYNFLTVNSRTVAVSVAILVNIPVLYFLFEIFVLNGVVIFVWITQMKKSQALLNKIKKV